MICKDVCMNTKINWFPDLQKSIMFISWYTTKLLLMSFQQLKEKSSLRVGKEKEKTNW